MTQFVMVESDTAFAHFHCEDIGWVDPSHRTPRDGSVEDKERYARDDDVGWARGAARCVRVPSCSAAELNVTPETM